LENKNLAGSWEAHQTQSNFVLNLTIIKVTEAHRIDKLEPIEHFSTADQLLEQLSTHLASHAETAFSLPITSNNLQLG
jgi:hypothetical protein